MSFLLYGPSYKVGRGSESDNTNHKVFGLNDMDDFCDLLKELKNPGGLVFFFGLRFSFPCGGKDWCLSLSK